MNDFILDIAEKLKPYEPEFISIVSAAWQKSQATISTYGRRPSNRFIANAMWEHMRQEAMATFKEIGEVTCDNRKSSLLLHFPMGITVRLKRINDNFQPANIKTQYQFEFLEQCLPGFEQDHVLITVGYKTDDLRSALEGVYWVYQNKNHHEYKQIEERENTIQFSNEKERDDQVNPVVRIRKGQGLAGSQ